MCYLAGFVSESNSTVLERKLVLSNNGSRLFGTQVRNHVHIRGPKLELTLPIDKSRKWRTDEEWSLGVALLEERVEERDGLNGLAETHLVG